MFRSHQQQALEACRQIKATEKRRIIAYVVPGGGKSTLPVILAKELIPYVADNFAWITPRINLCTQAESAFSEGWLRSLLGHENEIRPRTNDPDLLLGKVGYVTTYQAFTAARHYRPNPHTQLFQHKRMILVLDEPYHAAFDSETALALQPLVDQAAVLLLMGGHFSRNDNERIAFVDYLERDGKGRFLVDLNESARQTVIKYGLRDATREKALININFELRDCTAEWETYDEFGGLIEDDKISSFDGASRYRTGKGLYTSLQTEFFESLLCNAAEFLAGTRRKHNPRSLFLIVTPYIEHAKRALGFSAKDEFQRGHQPQADAGEVKSAAQY